MNTLNCGSMAGRYRLQKGKLLPNGEEGPITEDTGWFDNLITDYGLNKIGTGGAGDRVFVGSGSDTPTVLDTALQSLIGNSNTQNASSGGQQPTAPYFGWQRRTWRFAAGTATGNISEVGIGDAATQLFSRALVVDSGGLPTSITVLADEYLDVTYELRVYAPTVDQTGTCLIGGVTYNWTSRASTVTDSSWTIAVLQYGARGASAHQVAWYTGPIGTVTQAPSGTQVSSKTGTFEAYSNNSKQLKTLMNAGLTDANHASGIRSIRYLTATMGCFQIDFGASVPKDATKVWTQTFGISWDRYTP